MQNKRTQFFSLTIERILPVILCLCLCLSACSSQNSNLFTYAIDISDGVFSPKNVEFNMTVDEVLRAMKLSEDDVNREESYPRIIHTIAIPGLSDNIQEIFNFDKLNSDEDKLVSVEYFISVSEEDLEKTAQTLGKQADAVMPPEFLMNEENGIARGFKTSWEDEQKNYVFVSFTYSENPAITLQLTMTRGDRKTLID